MEVTASERELLWIATFRYCLGRQTYVVGECVEMLQRHWQHLPPNARAVISRDLREAFERDARSRESGSTYHPLGADCDRREWEKILQLVNATGSETQA